jgi:DNA-directed RNA polymerase specialized sigma24 family protein
MQRSAPKEISVDDLRRAVVHLRPELRDVMILCGLSGRSYEEAAIVLGKPKTLIRERMNKARLVIARQILNWTRIA